MTKKMSVYDIRNVQDACRYAKKNGGTIVERTRHTMIVGKNGSTFLPRHKCDFKTGTRYAIIKQLIAIGLGILVIFVYNWSF